MQIDDGLAASTYYKALNAELQVGSFFSLVNNLRKRFAFIYIPQDWAEIFCNGEMCVLNKC